MNYACLSWNTPLRKNWPKVTVLNPEHLFEQADDLISAAGARQANLKRAIPAAYYGLFHATLAEAADLVIGVTKRSTIQYELVYRSVDHARLRDVCNQVIAPSPKYKPYAPPGGFGQDIKIFAATLVEMQDKRHTADYDPLFRAKKSDALIAVRQSRAALLNLENASPGEREAFLLLLLFRPRG